MPFGARGTTVLYVLKLEGPSTKEEAQDKDACGGCSWMEEVEDQ
jgi:hypothetical protein